MRLELFSYDPGAGFSQPLPAERPTFLLVFGATSLSEDASFWARLGDAFAGVPIAGCSTAGEVLGTRVTDGGAVIAAIQLRAGSARVETVRVSEAGESYGAGATLAKRLSGPDLRGVLVFSDGRVVNGSSLVRGLDDHLPAGTVVTGGLAGDGKRFERTWVVGEAGPQGGAITAVGLFGSSLSLFHGSQGGWTAFGPERLVTAAEGSVLYRLDDRPALEVYKLYLGDKAKELPASALRFPLSVRADKDDRRSVVRTILGVDERRQSMTFAGDVPQGSLVRLMQASFDRLLDGAAQASQEAARAWTSGDALCIVVSCVGRRLVLGERVEEELESVRGHLPQGVGMIGFYSYGEISPLAPGECGLHNQTMTLTILSEQLASTVS